MTSIRRRIDACLLSFLLLAGSTYGRGRIRTELTAREKLGRIVIPEITFREAELTDVVSFLAQACREYDPEPDPAKKGVNIIVNLSAPGEKVPMAVPTLTLNLRRVSAFQVLQLVCNATGLKARIDKNVVMIVRGDVGPGPMVTKVYAVLPTFGDYLPRTTKKQSFNRWSSNTKPDPWQQDSGGQPPAAGSSGNATAFFKKMGVPFPEGSSATYNAAISKLIVVNNRENQDMLLQILKQMGVVMGE